MTTTHPSPPVAVWPLYILEFTDDIDVMSASNDEFQHLTNRLVVKARAYGMKISTQKEQGRYSMNHISADRRPEVVAK